MNRMEEITDLLDLLIILGPTASGKTSISLELADYFDCEIISADSMQIYREMDIGTDKVAGKIRRKIPHHLIDIVSPEEEFSVADYKKRAEKKISLINEKNNLPVMVGGTGLYINAVVENYLLPELPHTRLREVFKRYADNYGRNKLYRYLKQIDPQYAEKIHPNDIRRVTRALEIYFISGKTRTFFEYLQEKQPCRYRYLKIGIKRRRKILYRRINSRVDKMFARGLEDEVRELNKKYNLSTTARQALGYKEILDYFSGDIDKNEARRLIKKRTRQLAKKQLSFFKRDHDILWINPDNWEFQELIIRLAGIISEIFDLTNQKFKGLRAGI